MKNEFTPNSPEIISKHPFISDEHFLQTQIQLVEEFGFYNWDGLELKDALYEEIALGFYEEAIKRDLPTNFEYKEPGGVLSAIGRLASGRPSVYRGWELGCFIVSESEGMVVPQKNIVLKNGQLYEQVTIDERDIEKIDIAMIRLDNDEISYRGWLNASTKQDLYNEVRTLENLAINLLENS
jgi:hypothetical protein